MTVGILRLGYAGIGLAGLGLLAASPAAGSATTATVPESPVLMVAQAETIDFGDDASEWANDGECDDPRFEGAGAASTLLEEDREHDATDCRTLLEAGEISLAAGEGAASPDAGEIPDTAGTPDAPADAVEEPSPPPPPAPPVDAPPPLPPTEPVEDSGPDADAAGADIDFGDDSGAWPEDGECDDPRFTGTGMAIFPSEDSRLRDATDCRALFEQGDISLADETEAPVPPKPSPSTDTAAIDFGDDTSEWANDGECDDPRFEGEGMAIELLDKDIRHDASDCRALFEAGDITLADDGSESGLPAGQVDFGDDTSRWANDGECDDPRFAGTGMAVELVEADRMHDATDCRTLYEAGDITLAEDAPDDTATDTGTDIDFGDDSSTWANDGECDDPRFVGDGMASAPVAADLMADATDCRTAYEAGSITLMEPGDLSRFDFGDDSGDWTNDGECDDPRFVGPGMAKKVLNEDIMRDASDCSALVESGEVQIKPVYGPAYVAGAPYDSSSTDFGDNTSTYANDGVCDDPRFEGPGVASILLDSDELRDAADCRELFEAGRIVLVEESAAAGDPS